MKSYYEILEVSESASIEVIKMAYKGLARKYHPDLYKGNVGEANRKMQQVNEAYSVLSNENKRNCYNQELEESRKQNVSYKAEKNEETKNENVCSLSKDEIRRENFKKGKMGWFSLYAIVPLMILFWPVGIWLAYKRIKLTKDMPKLRKRAIIAVIVFIIFIAWGTTL